MEVDAFSSAPRVWEIGSHIVFTSLQTTTDATWSASERSAAKRRGHGSQVAFNGRGFSNVEKGFRSLHQERSYAKATLVDAVCLACCSGLGTYLFCNSVLR